MIEIITCDPNFIAKKRISFHGRENRAYSLERQYSDYLPDVFTIDISNNVAPTGWIEFRGTDCTKLINGILDSADRYTLKAIISGAQDRLEQDV
jgi:hypothetical protein